MAVVFRCDVCRTESFSSDFLVKLTIPYEEHYRSGLGLSKDCCNKCRVRMVKFIEDMVASHDPNMPSTIPPGDIKKSNTADALLPDDEIDI